MAKNEGVRLSSLRISRKGAIELSIGTIVIIVLAMTMLILGIVLISNIFKGATGITDLMNKNVEAQVNELFNDDNTKTVVYLPDRTADVNPNRRYSITFAIKNTDRNGAEASTFAYNIAATEINANCRGLTLDKANSYVSIGRTGNIKVAPGSEPVQRTIQLDIPESAPLCSINYDLVVNKDGQVYDTNFFIVNIEA